LLDELVKTFIESGDAPPDVLLRDLIATLGLWLRARKLIGPELAKRACEPRRVAAPRTPRRKEYLESTYERAEERHEGYGSLLFSALFDGSDWSRYVVSGRVDDFLPVKIGDPSPSSRAGPGHLPRR
jgi:hypothetical protein